MIGKADDLIRWLLNQDRQKLFEVKEHKEKRCKCISVGVNHKDCRSDEDKQG